MIQWMMDMIGQVGRWLMQILPTSPFAAFIDNLVLPDYVGWIAWFFPVHELIIVLIAWLGAITVFYAYSVIMRWVKLIGD